MCSKNKKRYIKRYGDDMKKILLIVIILGIFFSIHLMNRYNKLNDRYQSCIDTVKIYHNAWNQR